MADEPRLGGGVDAVPAVLAPVHLDDDRRAGRGGGGTPLGVIEGRARAPPVHVGSHADQVLLILLVQTKRTITYFFVAHDLMSNYARTFS